MSPATDPARASVIPAIVSLDRWGRAWPTFCSLTSFPWLPPAVRTSWARYHTPFSSIGVRRDRPFGLRPRQPGLGEPGRQPRQPARPTLPRQSRASRVEYHGLSAVTDPRPGSPGEEDGHV